MEVRAGRDEIPDRGPRLDDLLEVVEDEQQLALADMAPQVVTGAEHARDLLEHELRLLDRRQLEPEDAGPELGHELRRRLDGEARLAGATRSGEREQPRSLADA